VDIGPGFVKKHYHLVVRLVEKDRMVAKSPQNSSPGVSQPYQLPEAPLEVTSEQSPSSSQHF
jgi:hypothetical protein